jgi:hypothetical protein
MDKKEVKINQWLDNPQRILVGGVVVGVGGFLLYKYGKKLYDDMQHKRTEDSADDSPEVRQAMNFRSGINPSGIAWMKTFDSLNYDMIMDTAKTVTNLDAVSSAYTKLYGDDLLADLQRELNPENYQRFLTLVSSNTTKKGGAAPQKFAKKNALIVSIGEAFIRSSPDASYHGAIYEVNDKKNIIRKSIVGEFLGYATGKQSFDLKNNVKFIEVGYIVKKEGLPATMKAKAGMKVSYWISSSSNFIVQYAFFNDMLKQYPAMQAEVAYKKPLDFYSGIKGMSGIQHIPVITKQRTTVLDAKLQPVMNVQEGTLLGTYLMSLNTGTANYIQFRTIDNTLRWVKAEAIRTNPLIPLK